MLGGDSSHSSLCDEFNSPARPESPTWSDRKKAKTLSPVLIGALWVSTVIFALFTGMSLRNPSQCPSSTIRYSVFPLKPDPARHERTDTAVTKAEIDSARLRWIQYRTWTEYSSDDVSVADKAWAAFETNGFVALSHGWAAQQQLPVAGNMPTNASEGVYVLDGFHQLHCLIVLREHIADLSSGKVPELPPSHMAHCLDYLRQAVQCRADDTPMYAGHAGITAGNGQLRQCRDWEALTDWAQRYSACWPTGECESAGS